jgi:hypothetical protein
VVGRIIGGVIARAVYFWVHWRRPWYVASDLAFEGASTFFEVSTAIVLVHALMPQGDPVGPLGLLAVFVATGISSTLRSSVIELSMTALGGWLEPRRSAKHLAFGLDVTSRPPGWRSPSSWCCGSRRVRAGCSRSRSGWS